MAQRLLLDTAAIVTIATSNKAGSTILVGGSELVAAGDAFATASFHMSAAELDGIMWLVSSRSEAQQRLRLN